MKKLLIVILFIQGVLVSAVLDSVEVNGVKVPLIFERDSHLPIASLQLVIQKSGSIEDGKKYGLARFCASMLGEGTKKMGSIRFSEELENRAINLSVNSGAETFVFEVSSLKEQFEYALKMLKKLIGDPNFSDESFHKVKSQTLGALLNKQSDFDYIANVNLKKILYKDTPVSHPFAGDKKSIESLKLEDVETFYKEHIDLSNAIVIIGGDLSLNEAKTLLKSLLLDMKKGRKRELGHFDVSGSKESVVVKKDTQQAYIYFGSPYDMKSGDEHRYIARVASFILGEGGFGSRLMEEIRVKRGLAYSAYSRVNINKSYSSFTGYLQTKNESGKEAVKLVKEEIEKFVSKGVSKDELEQAKKFILGSEPLRNETLSQRLSRAFFEYYNGFKLGHSKEELKKIEALKLDDLNSFIKKHTEIENLSFSIVTNADKL